MFYYPKQTNSIGFSLYLFVSCFFMLFPAIPLASLSIRSKLLERTVEAIGGNKKVVFNPGSATDLVLLLCEESPQVVHQFLPKILTYFDQYKQSFSRDQVMKRAIKKGNPALVAFLLEQGVYNKESLIKGKKFHLFSKWSLLRKAYFLYEAYFFSFLPSTISRSLRILSILYYATSFLSKFFSIKHPLYLSIYQIFRDINYLLHFGMVKNFHYSIQIVISLSLGLIYAFLIACYWVKKMNFYARKMSYLHLALLASTSPINKNKIVKLLIKKGADPNAQALIIQPFSLVFLGIPEQVDSWLGLRHYSILTPLLLAQQQRDKKLVLQLIKAGAQPIDKKKRVYRRDQFKLDPEKRKLPLTYVSTEKIFHLIKPKN